MRIDDMTPSKYLKRADVDPPVLVTIDRFSRENVARQNQPAEMKFVMHFRELEKPLVLNKTNLKRCANAFGSEETDDWLGKKIVAYYDDSIEMGGEIVGGIRLRAAKGAAEPAPAKAAPAQAHGQDFDDSLPF